MRSMGWECISQNLLSCQSCKQIISFKATKKTKETVPLAYKITVAHFVELLQKGHSIECHWRIIPSPENFSRLPANKIIMEKVYLNNLRSYNVTNGVSNTFNLPVLTQEFREKFLKELPDENIEEVTDAMLLAASGWRLKDTRQQQQQRQQRQTFLNNYTNENSTICNNSNNRNTNNAFSLVPNNKTNNSICLYNNNSDNRSLSSQENQSKVVNKFIFSSEHFRLHCKFCNRNLPLKQYRLKSHNTIIPDTPSLRIHELRISNAPILSPFSIDHSPPTFHSELENTGSFSFWEPGCDNFSRKRKYSLEKTTDSTDMDIPNAKRTCFGQNFAVPVPKKKAAPSFSRIEEHRPSPKRKRVRDDDIEIEDSSPESDCKKRKVEIETSTKISFEQEAKMCRKRSVESNFETPMCKRLRTNTGGRSFSKAFDPIREHRIGCPYSSHYFYPTGSGEVPGWIHSTRCMQLDPTILRARIEKD
eukprot:UN30136